MLEKPSPEELLKALQAQFEIRPSRFARSLLNSLVDGDSLTAIFTNDLSMVFGISWSASEILCQFPGLSTAELGEIMFRDVDEPNGPGHIDPDRARGLVDAPNDVRWLDDA